MLLMYVMILQKAAAHAAAENGHAGIMRLLVILGAEINAKDNSGVSNANFGFLIWW